jgi:hypothetical protein
VSKIRGITLQGTWSPEEHAHLGHILAPLPAAWLEENPYIKQFVRRPVLTDGPPDAPGHSKYEPTGGSIVVFDKGVYHGEKIDPEQFGRSVYHELAHTLLRLHPDLLDRWTGQTRGDGFVDQYARTGPDEDFADTFSEFFLHTERVGRGFPRKAGFIRRLLAEATEEKIAMEFMNAFADELTKTAAGPLGELGGMAIRGLRGPVGKGVLAAGAAGGGGLALGASKGREKGMMEGTAQMDEGMRAAYTMGVRRGAQAMYQQIATQMQGSQSRPKRAPSQ